MAIDNALNRRSSEYGVWHWLITCALVIVGPLALAKPDYAGQWGPDVGTAAPLLEADDQNGERQTLDTLAGPKGLLLVFSRSVDW